MDNLSFINTYGPYTREDSPESVVSTPEVQSRGTQLHRAAEPAAPSPEASCLLCVLLTPASLPGLVGKSSFTSEEKHSH